MQRGGLIILAIYALLVYLTSGWTQLLLLGIGAATFLWILPQDEVIPPDTKHKKSLCHDVYNFSKVPKNLDVIVIGSGMGGLTAAAQLARMGKKVVVFEQHDVAGGCTHMFELGSGYQFDSGLHYAVPYCADLLQLVAGGEEPPVRFEKLGIEDGTFDKIVLGDDEPFHIKHGEAHMPALYEMFPDEKDALDEYKRQTNVVLDKFPLWLISKFFPVWLQRIWSNLFLKSFSKASASTYKESLFKISKNQKLNSLLSGLWIDTGTDPAVCSFMLSACVFRGLPIEGGAYPVGGPEKMAKTVVPVIEKFGGRVLCKVSVEELIVDEKTGVCSGVRLEDGSEVLAPTVISSIGYTNTFEKLIEPEISDKFGMPTGKDSPLIPSPGFVMANIGIKGDAKSLGLDCTNTWYHPTIDESAFDALDVFWKDPFDKRLNGMAPSMITFPSLKDRGWPHKDKITCQMLVPSKWEWFERWQKGASGHRGSAEYDELKSQWEQVMMKTLFTHFPQVKDHIELVDVSTPLSIYYYTKSPEGGACGFDSTPRRFSDYEGCEKYLNMKTPFQGLWLTGQDTILPGVPMVQIAGLITALRVGGLFKGLGFLAHVFRLILRGQLLK